MACRWDIFKNRCVLKIGFKSASFGKRKLLCIILSENKRCTIALYHIVQSFFFTLPATFFLLIFLKHELSWKLLRKPIHRSSKDHSPETHGSSVYTNVSNWSAITISPSFFLYFIMAIIFIIFNIPTMIIVILSLI